MNTLTSLKLPDYLSRELSVGTPKEYPLITLLNKTLQQWSSVALRRSLEVHASFAAFPAMRAHLEQMGYQIKRLSELQIEALYRYTMEPKSEIETWNAIIFLATLYFKSAKVRRGRSYSRNRLAKQHCFPIIVSQINESDSLIEIEVPISVLPPMDSLDEFKQNVKLHLPSHFQIMVRSVTPKEQNKLGEFRLSPNLRLIERRI